MRKRTGPLRASARWAAPAMRGFGRRVLLIMIVPFALLALAGAAVFGRGVQTGEAERTPPLAAAWPGPGVRVAVAEPPAASSGPASDWTESASALDALLDRAERASDLWDQVEAHVQREIAPIEQLLLEFRPDSALVRRIALALVAEARRVELDPRVLVAVLLVENPDLEPTARSFVGATGLMQVMPMHVGHWPPCGTDLEGVETNICYGARIFAHYYRQTGGDVERALLRYNGCVRGTNTPTCHSYPDQVFARAGRASLLAWLRPQGARAASP